MMDMKIHHDAKRADGKRAGCGCACGSIHPVDVLSQEHQTILTVLAAAEKEMRALQQGGAVRTPFWSGVLEFLEHYADRCHHAKEENLLFVELEQAGLPASHGPTVCMRAEHVAGRGMRARMVAGLQAADGVALARAAGEYVVLLREHIEKEDHVLFPLAKSVLQKTAVDRIRRGFERVENDDLGQGAHCRYEELARNLVAGSP